MTAVNVELATQVRLPAGFGTLPRDDPPDPRTWPLFRRLLPDVRVYGHERVRPDRRRGPARRDQRQAGHLHLARGLAVLRVRGDDRDDHPVGSRAPQGREGRRPDAAADRLVTPKVTSERRGPAAVVTINRRERRNAVDGETGALLGEAFQTFEADDDARVFILTGAGGEAFCAGADLKDIES